MTPELLGTVDDTTAQAILDLLGETGPLTKRPGGIAELVDALKAVAASGDDAVRRTAHDKLRRLVQHIAEALIVAQVQARTPKGSGAFDFRADNMLWLASRAHHAHHWSVVSLNYDNLLDRAFEELAVSAPDLSESQYRRWQRLLDAHFNNRPYDWGQRGIYLKLHGSLDLYECLNEACPMSKRPLNIRANRPLEVARRGYFVDMMSLIRAACSSCGEPLLPLILPPGRNATVHEGAYHRALYAKAALAFDAADTWVLLGYSWPQYDVDIVATLRSVVARKPSSGIERRIYVVAPDAEEIAPRVAHDLGWPVDAVPTTFTGLVNAALEAEGVQRPLHVLTSPEDLAAFEQFLSGRNAQDATRASEEKESGT